MAEPAANLPKPVTKSNDSAAPSAADDYKKNLTNLEAPDAFTDALIAML